MSRRHEFFFISVVVGADGTPKMTANVDAFTAEKAAGANRVSRNKQLVCFFVPGGFEVDREGRPLKVVDTVFQPLEGVRLQKVSHSIFRNGRTVPYEENAFYKTPKPAPQTPPAAIAEDVPE